MPTVFAAQGPPGRRSFLKMRRLQVSLSALVALLIGANCRQLSIKDGALLCSVDGQCPAPYHCHKLDNRCWKEPEITDGGDVAVDSRSDSDSGSERDSRSDEGDSAIMRDDGSVGDAPLLTDALDAVPSDTQETPMSTAFGSPCDSDEQCRTIGPEYFCLKTFQDIAIPSGSCTLICSYDTTVDPPASVGCDSMATCISENVTSSTPNPLKVCFSTCNLDVPCRSGFKCQFTYRNDMLVEPSVCVPASL